MNKIIHNTLYMLAQDPEVSKVFHTRVPKTINTMTKPLANTEKWLMQVYDGTFIDSKFEDSWLQFHTIQKNMLYFVQNDMHLVCNLFTECVKDCVKLTDKYDSFDTFLFNTDTFRSGFLRHANKVASVHIENQFKKRYNKRTLSAISMVQDKSIQPIWGAIDAFHSWYTTQKDSLISANYAVLSNIPLLQEQSILLHFCDWLNDELETVVPGALKVGGRFWWEFSKQMKSEYNINLNPTQEEIRRGELMASKTDTVKIESICKPRGFILMSPQEKFIWQLKNDAEFLSVLEKTNKKAVDYWNSTLQNEKLMLEYMSR